MGSRGDAFTDLFTDNTDNTDSVHCQIYFTSKLAIFKIFIIHEYMFVIRNNEFVTNVFDIHVFKNL